MIRSDCLFFQIAQVAKSRELTGRWQKSSLSKQPFKPLADLQREVEIMTSLCHPNLVKLYEVIDDRETGKLLMVVEFCEGGTLVNPGQLTPERRMPEAIAHFYFRQVVAGLAFLHSNGVVHGDIKPENILLAGDSCVKIADFGQSQFMEQGDDTLHRTLGTPAYLSPEICEGGQYRGRAADIWALGVSLYSFVYGEMPFKGESLFDLYESIAAAEIEFPQHVPLSIELQDLLLRMMCKDPNIRISADELLQHPWVREDDLLALMPSLIHEDTSDDENLQRALELSLLEHSPSCPARIEDEESATKDFIQDTSATESCTGLKSDLETEGTKEQEGIPSSIGSQAASSPFLPKFSSDVSLKTAVLKAREVAEVVFPFLVMNEKLPEGNDIMGKHAKQMQSVKEESKETDDNTSLVGALMRSNAMVGEFNWIRDHKKKFHDLSRDSVIFQKGSQGYPRGKEKSETLNEQKTDARLNQNANNDTEGQVQRSPPSEFMLMKDQIRKAQKKILEGENMNSEQHSLHANSEETSRQIEGPHVTLEAHSTRPKTFTSQLPSTTNDITKQHNIKHLYSPFSSKSNIQGMDSFPNCPLESSIDNMELLADDETAAERKSIEVESKSGSSHSRSSAKDQEHKKNVLQSNHVLSLISRISTRAARKPKSEDHTSPSKHHARNVEASSKGSREETSASVGTNEAQIQWLLCRAGQRLECFSGEANQNVVYYIESGTCELHWEAVLPVKLTTVFSEAFQNIPKADNIESIARVSSKKRLPASGERSGSLDSRSSSEKMRQYDSIAISARHVADLSQMLPRRDQGNRSVLTKGTETSIDNGNEEGQKNLIEKSLQRAVHRAETLLANAVGGSLDNLLISERCAGQYVGALSMLDPHSMASRWRQYAIASTDCTLIRMTREGLDLFLSQNPLAQVYLRASMALGRYEIVKLEVLERIAHAQLRHERARNKKKKSWKSTLKEYVGVPIGEVLDAAGSTTPDFDELSRHASIQGTTSGIDTHIKSLAPRDLFALVSTLREAFYQDDDRAAKK